jgi:predicted nucleic acid-binding protein
VIVVDASVALAWCFADESDDYAEQILERVVRESAITPGHWPLEIANGLRSAERRGRIEAGEVGRVRQLLADLGIEVVPVELQTAMGTVLDAARTYDLSAYDATYLDLALARGLPIATIDARLAASCRDAGVELAA